MGLAQATSPQLGGPHPVGAAPCTRGHRQRCRSVPGTKEATQSPQELADPQAKFRQYGIHFGGRHSMDLGELMGAAPRIRMRSVDERQRGQLAELAVLNERLAGRQSWQIRQKLEHLKSRRRIWELIYEYVTKRDAIASLEMIEEANNKVTHLLSEESREHASVAALTSQLVELQAEVQTAHERLHQTQARVEHNLERVSALKAEAASLEKMRQRSAAEGSSSQGVARRPLAAAADLSAAALESQQAQAAEALPSTSHMTGAGSRPAVLEPDLKSAGAEGDMPLAAPLQRQLEQAEAQRQQRRGLHSSLHLEQGLRNHWYPVAFSSKLPGDMLVPFDLFGQAWVLFRDARGVAACVRDQCAHRACPLSLGRVVDGKVQCPYHGWEYTGSGHCVAMPSTTPCPGVRVDSLACSEQDGFVWVFPGDEAAMPAELPALAQPPPGYVIHAEIEVEVPVEHGLLLENLLDLAHAPFTHTSTFAKGWPVPDFVRFNAGKLLGGNWEPYPIDMSFEPPCCVLSTIGLAQPGKIQRGQRAQNCQNHLHQLHACLPSRPGHTRLLYRMSMDFMGWARMVPGIQRFWQHIAGQVLGEDLVLVKGQQERMCQGADTWARPVSYDKLAVRYRRWRNSLDKGKAEQEAAEASLAAMSAGEVFSIDDNDMDSCNEQDGCPT